ncbi:MAG: M14 metallopeptidase family protein [Ferruginibacter sp.]
MRKIFLIHCFTTLLFSAQAQQLSYYLPEGVQYNTAIPTPASIIHHEVGEWHITHDRLINYMQAIANAAPDRVKIETMGYTYEQRPQVLLIISSKENHSRLEQIRQEHLQLSDPIKSANANISKMPIVVYIGHSIHGNEPSGSNAALLTAYHLAAAQGADIEELLSNTVILFDPSFNPDGLQRFSTWANQHKSKNLVTDPSSREFNEVWPGGRFNHYWFDLNRDWLPGVHPESRNRISVYHKWKPNILTDHHEQGSNASFFFQPGVPSRVNPLTPATNIELTEKLARYHAKQLDKIGSLYFTKENYDDFYYGKGSTFPDINGAVGILFEQASSRGHAQETTNGILRFPATIKNQFVTALSTLEGALALRTSFLSFQRDFYKQSVNAIGGYVFGDKNDRAKTALFIEMLMRHGIEVKEYTGATDAEFDKGSTYTVALNQPQQVLIKAIFNKQLTFTDSLFYDISSWTMPLAYGIPYKQSASINSGNLLSTAPALRGEVTGGKSDYAYVMEWDEFYAPKALYELQQKGLITKVATNKTSITTASGENKIFDYGSILIPVKMQSVTPDALHTILQNTSQANGLKFYAMQTGAAATGSDLGSSKYISLKQPAVAMIVGSGVSALDAGEVWHLLDQRMNIPASHLDAAAFNRADISKYNCIIMVSGNYGEMNKEKLKAWVQAGGVLILEEDAVVWASQNGISTVTVKRAKNPADSSASISYVQREQIEGAQQMNGAIFGAEVDLTHPLAYGYNQNTVSMFKGNKVFLEKSKNPYASPFQYGASPLQSGYISKENAAVVKNSAAVIVNTLGAGRVINIADNPNMRGFWLGGTKLLMNALFFGNIIDAASARTEE